MFLWLYRFLEKRYSRPQLAEASIKYPNKYYNGTTRQVSLNAKSMNFTIYSAAGGHVLEYAGYDSHNDRSISNLHLVPEGQDLGQTIAHAIAIEFLRN